jgi:queuine tRNA-ribosyltransferase
VGHPENVLACHQLGYDIFDSAMPTRDARHGRLYIFKNSENDVSIALSGDWFGYKYINDEEYIRSDAPISEFCDCPVCRNYPIGYLHHLFKQGDTLFMRLATLHNLRFMVQLCDRISRLPK